MKLWWRNQCYYWHQFNNLVWCRDVEIGRNLQIRYWPGCAPSRKHYGNPGILTWRTCKDRCTWRQSARYLDHREENLSLISSSNTLNIVQPKINTIINGSLSRQVSCINTQILGEVLEEELCKVLLWCRNMNYGIAWMSLTWLHRTKNNYTYKKAMETPSAAESRQHYSFNRPQWKKNQRSI